MMAKKPRREKVALENRDPFKLGLMACAGIVALALVIFLISAYGDAFSKNDYTAMAAQSAGLKAGEDVQIAGVNVGKVKSVVLDGSAVKISFTVDNGVHLGDQTTADIKVATLLGTHMLSVSPKGGGNLANDQIPLDRVGVPFNLQDVLNEGVGALQKLDAPKLAQLMTTMTNELSPSSKDLGPALQGVIAFTSAVSNRADQLGNLLTATRSVTGQLSASSNDIIGLMQQTDLVLSEITSRRDAIHQLLVQTTNLAQAVNGIIGDTKADVGPTLAALNGTLAELRSQDALLRHVLDVMAPAARYLANAAGNGRYLDLNNTVPLFCTNDSASKAGC